MAVTEQERHRLLAWFEEQMGHDLGATMMELMPPADGTALATKADLAELKSELLKTLGTWLFASQAAVIAAVAMLVAFGR